MRHIGGARVGKVSGDSMNHIYSRLINDANFNQHTPERKAFAAHLVKVAKALHDIEWVDSGDSSPGSENQAIRDCLHQSAVLDAAVETARQAQKELQIELERACSGDPKYKGET